MRAPVVGVDRHRPGDVSTARRCRSRGRRSWSSVSGHQDQRPAVGSGGAAIGAANAGAAPAASAAAPAGLQMLVMIVPTRKSGCGRYGRAGLTSRFNDTGNEDLTLIVQAFARRSGILDGDVERADIGALDLVGGDVQRRRRPGIRSVPAWPVCACPGPASVKLSTLIVSVPPTRVRVIGCLGMRMIDHRRASGGADEDRRGAAIRRAATTPPVVVISIGVGVDHHGSRRRSPRSSRSRGRRLQDQAERMQQPRHAPAWSAPPPRHEPAQARAMRRQGWPRQQGRGRTSSRCGATRLTSKITLLCKVNARVYHARLSRGQRRRYAPAP